MQKSDCIIGLLLAVLAGSQVQAAVIAAVTGDDDGVRAALAVSSVGDQILVPDGDWSWDQNVALTYRSLIGSGTNNVILRDNVTLAGSRQAPMITWRLTNSVIQMISGIQFARGTNTGVNFAGLIEINPGTVNVGSRSWAIRDCYFNQPYGRAIYLYNSHNSGGVLYRTFFDMRGAQQQALTVDGDRTTYGNVSWSTDFSAALGTTNEGFFIEGATLLNGPLHRAAIDAFAGARYVFRFNTITNGSIETHGTDSNGTRRSGRWVSVYGNTGYTSTSGEYGVRPSGGGGVICSNVFTGLYPGAMRVYNYRLTDGFSPYGIISGDNPFDLNDAVFSITGSHTGAGGATILEDASKSWTNSGLVSLIVENLSQRQIDVVTIPVAGSTLTLSGKTLTWASPVTVPSNQVQIAASAILCASNLVQQLAAFPVGGIIATQQLISGAYTRYASLRSSAAITASSSSVNVRIIPRSTFITASTATTATTFQNVVFGGNNVIFENGDLYVIRRVLRPLDGIGVGTGSAFGGGEYNPTPEAFPSQVLDPFYAWANTNNGVLSPIANSYTPAADENTNYFNSAKPGYTFLAYPHPLAVALDSGNFPPSITPLANQSTLVGLSTTPQAFTIADGESAASALTLSGNSSNTTLLPHAAITFSGTGSSRSVICAPVAPHTGTALVTVTVTDPGGLTNAATFTLTVSDNNLLRVPGAFPQRRR